jgi:hypothetical protein
VRPPPVLHWCSAFCSTWIWDGKRYVVQGKPRPEQTGGIAVTVERFTADQVILHRTDFGQFPGRADLHGKLSNYGNAFVNGLITWTYHPCCGLGSGSFNATWGPLIDRIPGSGSPPPHYADVLSSPVDAIAQAKSTTRSATVETPSLPLPAIMRFCGPMHCGTLTLRNGGYDAIYDDNPSGSVTSRFNVELFTTEAVRITRVDNDGFRAVLTGRISPAGNRIVAGNIGDGHYDMTWGSAMAQGNVQNAPATVHFCTAHCYELTLKNGQYVAGDMDGTITVKNFSGDSVLLEKNVPPDPLWPKGAKGIISGRISAAGNSLVDGKLTWLYGLHGTIRAQMTWDAALNNLPSDDPKPPTRPVLTPQEEAFMNMLRAVLPSPEQMEMSDYSRYKDRCTHGDADACRNAKNLRDDLVSEGVDVQ